MALVTNKHSLAFDIESVVSWRKFFWYRMKKCWSLKAWHDFGWQTSCDPILMKFGQEGLFFPSAVLVCADVFCSGSSGSWCCDGALLICDSELLLSCRLVVSVDAFCSRTPESCTGDGPQMICDSMLLVSSESEKEESGELVPSNLGCDLLVSEFLSAF